MPRRTAIRSRGASALAGRATSPRVNSAAQTSPNTLAKIKSAKAINVAFSGEPLPFSLADLECANTTQTQSRLASVDFSNRIFVDGGGFLLKAGSPINSLADPGGKRIAVLKGTTTETRLNDTLRRRLINATVVTIGDGNEGLAMLEAGSVDAYAGDKIELIGFAAQAKEPAKLAMLVEDLSFEPYAMALPRNDSALRLEVNKALTQIYLSGEIETIFARWLGKLGRPSGLLAAMYFLNVIPD